jgi:5-(carboxyamino)imidazole ribonucleotide synthase
MDSPNSRLTIGILGAGQLAAMLAQAGVPLGCRFIFLDPSEQPCAAVVGEHWQLPFDSGSVLKLSEAVDVVTFEFENIPAHSLVNLDSQPTVAVLKTAQDRLLEKQLFVDLGIQTNRFEELSSLSELEDLLPKFNGLVRLKTRQLGYDGKGQLLVNQDSLTSPEERATIEQLIRQSCIAEEQIDFDYEVSAIGVIDASGASLVYPLMCNTHKAGILRHTKVLVGDDLAVGDSVVSWGVVELLFKQAKAVIERLASHFGYVGVLTAEFFVKDNRLIANEIAPRVHNSGHWTIEGAVTSQFENHIRAISGWPLGKVACNGAVELWNIIGGEDGKAADHERIPDSVLAIPGAKLHLYGKAPRPNRKLGHVTLCENLIGREQFLASRKRLDQLFLENQ